MRRYRSDTPAARRRDAPARLRRTLLTWACGYLVVCLGALAGLVATAPGPSQPRTSPSHASTMHESGTDALLPAARDGKVSVDPFVARPLPDGWARVRPILSGAVREMNSGGNEVAACVLAIDAPDERMTCAGDDEPRYAASVIKVAFAVGALEAWNGNTSATTPYGRLGTLLDNAIEVSDNDTANLLYDLSVDGPTAPETDSSIEAINDIAARVGLEDEFHTGGAFRYVWTGDMSVVTASGSVRYLAELVRAADGRATGDDALTSQKIARQVLSRMLRQERDWKLAANLPQGSVANKTGETDTESHDIAVVNTATGRYAIAVIGSVNGMFTSADDAMAALGSDVVAALGGAARF